MPCPHNEITIVQRSQRQSAVAAAAYQSGEKLFCEYDQQVKHYPEKRGIVHNEILLPANAPPEYADRNTLWNAAEAVEKQWNSQLARRWVLTIPREIPPDQYAVLVREFCEQQFVSKGMILGYKASLIQGVTPGQIRERMEKLNPDRFRVRKFGVSDVIVTSIGGKTQSYYVNPKELIKFNGFFTKLPNGEYLLLNEEGYQVEGQKGTWTVTDEKTIDEQRFVLMVNDQKPDLLPSIVVQSDGKFITSTASGFDNATVRKVRELLHHEKFLENGTAERARESGTEQNYNMIDGCVNNVPKKPRVIGGRVSVLDRLHIKQAERARKDNAQVQQQERTRKN